MFIRPISEWMIYKHRFGIAFIILGACVAALLLLYPLQIPPGLSANEQSSILTSHAISFTQLPSAAQVVDLPYHALQKISISLIGITPYGVRLPSILFAALTALCVSLIIKRWFKTNVAIVSSLILITSTWFLGLGRLGTPDIMIPFWTSVLILSATYVSQQTKRWHLWKAVFGLSAALSLYTPYMAYLFIATLLAALAQPHLRYLIRQSSKVGLTIGTFFFVVLMVPLGWGIYKDPAILHAITGVPSLLPDVVQFGKNLLQALNILVNPLNVNSGELITPVLGVTMAAIALVGGLRLLSDFHSVRAYVLLIWMAILIPVIGFAPTHLTVLFVPIMLVTAIGINLIVRYWYRLFPANPYARIFGLLPLFVLLFSMVQFNYQRYLYSMLYSEQAANAFTSDPFLAQQEARRLPANTPLTIVAPASQQPLYAIITEKRPGSAAITANQTAPQHGEYLVAASEIPHVNLGLAPSTQIVNDHKNDSLRFNVYQR